MNGMLSGEAKNPVGARPSKCIIIIVILTGEWGEGCGTGKEVGTGERTRAAVGHQQVAQGVSWSFKQFSEKLTSELNLHLA
jgi:hypothetical protein